MVGNRRIQFVIVLDSCCISIGLVFIKNRPVSSFWVLRFWDLGVFVFEFWMLCIRDLGVFVFEIGCFVFEFWVLHFRDLGASCFGLHFRVLRFHKTTGKIEDVFLNRVCILGIFFRKQGQGFKPSAAHSYPNIGWVPHPPPPAFCQINFCAKIFTIYFFFVHCWASIQIWDAKQMFADVVL